MKRLKPGDEEEAGRIAERWYSGKGEVPEYRAFLSEKQNYILAAYSEGELAGFLIGYELKRLETSQPMMLLYTIDVLPKYQRKGVGKGLVNELKELCTRRGALKMFVITSESNQAAMGLYGSTGGKRESTDDVVFVYRAGLPGGTRHILLGRMTGHLVSRFCDEWRPVFSLDNTCGKTRK